MGKGDPIVLFEDEYSWVLNNDDGTCLLVKGPHRLVLLPNQTIVGRAKRRNTVVKEHEYVIVCNPFDEETGNCEMGQREIRKGPLTFALYPNETLDGGICSAYLLGVNEAIILQATTNHDDRKAGEKYKLMGPLEYIPTIFEQVLSVQKSIVVGQNEAIYIQNTDTSELRLVRGPVNYSLEVNEIPYEKEISSLEAKALGIGTIVHRKDKCFAYIIELAEEEVLCVVERQQGKEKYLKGPCVHFLGPYEGVKVVSLSGGVPKEENAQVVCKIRTGQDFMNDSFQISTKDNALLEVSVAYKWQFLLKDDELSKLFSCDFIGYSCQSMRSRIREEAARHDFEHFHSNSVEFIRARLFRNIDIPHHGKVFGRWFPETSLLVFDVDVKQIVPVDIEIAELFNQSIKSNMRILCRKLEDQAQLQAEKEEIQSKCEIAVLRRNVIEIENRNVEKERVGKAETEGSAEVERAKASASAEELVRRAAIERELQQMKDWMELLNSDAGKKLLDLERVRAIGENIKQATVVPDSVKSLYLPGSVPGVSSNEPYY